MLGKGESKVELAPFWWWCFTVDMGDGLRWRQSFLLALFGGGLRLEWSYLFCVFCLFFERG